MKKKLSLSFYESSDVVAIAKKLLGNKLCTKIDGEFTSGIIVETEAYAGETDRASHAFGGKFTERTKIMYEQGGTAYVYLCYGIHHLFNIVTNRKGIPHAVLIREILPVDGIAIMRKRRKKNKVDKSFSFGPGTLSQALGIHANHSGLNLTKDKIWLEDTGILISEKEISCTKRIGVEYAGEDAKLPYRFLLEAIPKLP